MSGIAGNLCRRGGGQGSGSRIGTMMKAIAHRGPDGVAVLEDGPAALGHAWLASTGRDSAGPHRLRPGGPVLVADLRLDAPGDLANRLGLARTTSDPDLILHAYDRWGLDFVERVDGDFALALWDPARREIFCVRDRFGVKPFYFHNGSNGFCFASEPAALLDVLPTTPDPDGVWVAEYLTGIVSSAGRTAHARISTLEPGNLLRSDGQEISRRRYWALTAARERPADVAPALQAALRDAVAERMQGGRVGAMLSGGLDSSAIACLATGEGSASHRDTESSPPMPLPVFSLIFEDFPEVDESAFIDAVLARGGFAPHFVGTSEHGAFDGAAAVMTEQQQPHAAMGLITTRGLYQSARQADLRVLLNGHGGDEVISTGIERLIELATAGQWATLWRETRGAALLCRQGRGDMFLELLSAHAPPRIVRGVARRLRGKAGGHDRSAWRRMVNRDLAQRVDLVERRRAALPKPEERLPAAMRMHIDRVAGPGMAAAFETLDRAAARQGMEARYPFFDRRVVELCVGQTAGAKLKDGRTRALLRDAMRGVLPDKVRLRPDKADFWPVGLHLLRHPRSLQRIDALAADPDVIADYVDVDTLRNHVARLHLGETEPAMLFEIWRSVWLSVWMTAPPARDRPAVPAPLQATPAAQAAQVVVP